MSSAHTRDHASKHGVGQEDDIHSVVNHLNIQNIGSNSHVDIDSHIADATIHFQENSIDHLNILNIGSNSHALIDAHIADSTIHFIESAIDHLNIQNIGVKAHTVIDNHIDNVSEDHTQYLLLDGTRNMNGNLTIQKTAPSLILGDIGEDYSLTVSTNNLTIINTTGYANGAIVIDHPINLTPSAPNTAAFNQKWSILSQPTLTIAAVSNYSVLSEQGVYTLDGVFSSFSIINALGTIENINAGVGAVYLFVSQMVSFSDTVGIPPSSYRSFDHRGVIRADAAAVGITDHMRALYDIGAVEAINNGSITLTEWAIASNGSIAPLGVISATAGASATVTNRYGFRYINTSLAGAGGTEVLVNQYGFHCGPLTTVSTINCCAWFGGASGATNNYGAVIASDDPDGGAFWFGAGQDAKIYYNGTDLFVNPKVTGSGAFHILGDLLFTGEGHGLPFGEIYALNNAVTMSVSSAGYTQVVIFDTNGESNNTTPDHINDHITIVEAGKYLLTLSMTISNGAGTSHTLDIDVAKNGKTVDFDQCHAYRTLSAGTDIGSVSISGIIDVTINDTIEVWISSDRALASTITVVDITLSIVEVGGT